MATYYVRSSGGSDGNAGTSFGAGWATVQKAADTAVAGDLVLICADGTHSPTTQIDWDTNVGTAASPIVFRGAGATGSDDGTVATISGASLTAGHDLFEFTVTGGGTKHIRFEGLRLTAGKAHNINSVGAVLSVTFYKCRIDTATTDGYRTDNASSTVYMMACEIDSNGAEGIGQSTNTRGNAYISGCSIHDNTGNGIDMGATMIVLNCLIYDNGADGFKCDGQLRAFFNNTLERNTGDGLDIGSATFHLGGNNIFANNGAYGVNHGGARKTQPAVFRNNLYYNNTSGNVDVDSGAVTSTDGDSITGSDPLFTSVTDGSENYAIGSTSPAKAAGYPGVFPAGATGYLDIGAVQRQEPASSGGGYVIGG